MRINHVRTVFPGDSLEENVERIHKHNNTSTMFGELYNVGKLNMLSTRGIYYPQIHDLIICRIFYKCSDFYKCDINGHIGLLPALSFKDASKRNKPELEVGDYVIGKVVKICSEVLITCNDNNLGKIEGYLDSFSLPQIKRLYLGEINEIGKRFKCDMWIGLNGKICCSGDPLVVNEVFKYIHNI
ncbi:hypothetical protein H312_03391 [Anncaliia algerae PRA339]|uniref:S1 motif domain-containing protein n=1 Tax=Anncaliia algerae PRA339 TaxID=1288291 RepID=A0A059EWG4_9MICR|nr:hypothetical protein H312_03391 [Anncaliia algerae PRA339]